MDIGKKAPQATHSDDYHTYRCYLRGPDGVRGRSSCGPGALSKLGLIAPFVKLADGERLVIPGVYVESTPVGYPRRQASSTCSIRGGPRSSHNTETASKRTMPGFRRLPLSHAAAT